MKTFKDLFEGVVVQFKPKTTTSGPSINYHDKPLPGFYYKHDGSEWGPHSDHEEALNAYHHHVARSQPLTGYEKAVDDQNIRRMHDHLTNAGWSRTGHESGGVSVYRKPGTSDTFETENAEDGPSWRRRYTATIGGGRPYSATSHRGYDESSLRQHLEEKP